MGGTGGILVASHLVGPRDAPHDRRARRAATRSTSRCGTSSRRCPSRRNPIPVKAALNMLGAEVGGLRLPLVEASEDEAAVIRERARAPRAAERGLSRHPPGSAAGRARRDRQEHDGRRVRRPHRRRGHRADVPHARPARHRPRAAGLHLPARAGGRHRRRSCSPTGTRTTWARCRSCCARSAPRPPEHLRRPADGRDGALQARRAQAQATCRSRTCWPGESFEAARSGSRW